MTPAPELPTEAERVRNRAHGQITRARTVQRQARIDRDGTREQWATQHIDRMLDDLLSLRPRKLNATYTAPAT